MLLGFTLLAGSITTEMVSSGNHRSPEGREKVMVNIPKVSAAGRNLWGTPTLTCAQSASTSGSAGSLSSRSEHATAATPASESTFVRHLNHLDINGEEVGSLQGAIVAKRKKRGSRAIAGEKSGRGLRQFSMKVCEKVESKGATTYNEVADELVAEFADPNNNLTSPDQQQYDEKNIRRRVYDALNVLMAMDIISKDKKEIQWKGLPRTSLNDIEELKVEAASLKSKIERKTAYLHELEDQLTTPFDIKIIGIQNLIQRNEQLHGSGNVPSGGVALPFILVQTRPHATVEVEISEDMQLVHFDFNSTPFELHDDNYVLKQMRLCDRNQNDGEHELILNGGECSRITAMYPPKKALWHSPTPTSKLPTSPPIPGILKASLKHENHNR